MKSFMQDCNIIKMHSASEVLESVFILRMYLENNRKDRYGKYVFRFVIY